MPVNQERLYQLTNIGVAGLEQDDRLYQLVNVGIDGTLQRDDRLYQYTNMVAGTPCPWVNGTDKAIATPNQPLTIYGRGFEPATTDTGPEARAYHTNDPNGSYTVMGALTAWTDEEVTVSVPPGIPNPSFIRVVHTGPDATTLCTGSNLVFQQVAPFDPIPADPEAGWWVEAWDLDNTGPLVRGIPVIEGPWQAVLNDIGDGSITVPAPDPDNDDAWNRHRELCDPPNNVATLLKVYIDGRYAYSFWADQISDPYGEPASTVVDITGRGLEAITDWGRLYPRDYDSAAPLASTRFPDWNYGFALSYFENFEGSNTVGPDWASRNDGYLLETLTPGVFEVVPAGGLRSGIQRTYKVEPGTELVWSIEVQAITTPGQRITAGVAFGEEAISVISPNTFEIDGEYLSEIGNVPYAGGCPGGATSASWQAIVVQLVIPNDVDSITTFVQSDHAASCGAPGNIPFYYRNAGFLGRGWNTPQGWYSTNLTVFEVRAGLGKDLTNGLYVQGDTTGAFSFTNVEVAVNPGEPVALIAECATTAVWYVEAADVETGLPLSTTTPLAGTGAYELRRVDWTPPDGVTSVLLRVVFDINQGTFEAQIDNVGVASGQDPATPGRIIREMLEAIQLRGTATAIDIDFTDTNDSDGNLWTRSISMNFGHGQTLYEILGALVSQGFEWQVAPLFASIGGDTGIVLSLFNGRATGAIYGVGENQEVTNPTGAATIRQGQIMTEGESTQVVPRNVTFGEGATDQANGGTRVTQAIDGDAVTGYGRREDFFTNAQALDAQTLQDAAATRLDNLRKQSVAATVELLQASPYIPGVDFRLGDTIQVDLGTQIPQGWYRVARIGGALAGEGDVDIRYVVDIGTVIVPEDAVEAVTLSRLVALTQLQGSTPGSGQSTGTTTGVSGAPLILPGTDVGPHTHPYGEIIPGGLTGDLKGTNPTPTVQGIQGKRVTTATPAIRDILAWDADAAIWELGRRMNWLDTWIEGAEYYVGDVVRDGAWTMAANTTTTDDPGPTPVSQAQWLLPTTPAWIESQVSDTLTMGIRVHGITDTFYAEGIRVWIADLSANTIYQVAEIDNTTGATDILAPFAGADVPAIGWFNIGRPIILGPGADFSVLLQVHSDIKLTPTTEPWTWTGFSNSKADPGTGNVNAKSNGTILRINNVDANAVDQSTLLGNVTPGTLVTVTQQSDANKWAAFLVAVAEAETGWHNFATTSAAQGPSGPPDDDALCDVKLENPQLDPMEKRVLPNEWIANANLDGVYAEGTAAPAFDDNAYGVDLYYQEFERSADWDVVAVSSAAGAVGGGGGAAGGHVIEDEGTPLPAQPTLNFAGAGVTATDDPGNTATLVTIPGGGGGASAIPANGAKVRLNANAPLPAGAWTPVPWQQADWDDLAYWNPGTPTRLTIPAGADGRYLITGEANITNASTAGDRLLHIVKNGVPLDEILSSGDQAIVVSSHRIQITGLVDLVAGDYIELEAITTAPIALQFIGSPTNTLHTQLAISQVTGPAPNPIATAKVYLDTVYSAPTIWSGGLAWDAVEWDTSSFWNPANPKRITFPRAGRYHIEANIYWVAATSGVRGGRVLLNGNATLELLQVLSNATTAFDKRMVVSGDITVAAGDYIELDTYQDTGVNLNMPGSPTLGIERNQLSVFEITANNVVTSERGELIVAGAGAASVVTGTNRVYAAAGRTIKTVRVSCGTAPSGGPLTIDVKLNGTTSIFPTTPLPACADGTNDSGLVIPDTTGWASGTYLTFDIDEANGAEDVTIQLEWEVA